MEVKARNRRRSSLTTTRKPLSDRTNTISQSQSSTTKPKPYFQPKNNPNPTSTSAAAFGSANNVAEPSTPLPPPRPSSSPGGDDNDDVLEIRTVYTRRQTADKKKGKEKKTVAVPFSSYSADRLLNARNKRTDYEDKGRWEPFTVPSKKQCHAQLEQDASENTLQDYVQQQRAYFSEVDAFELPEEEVGSGSELD